MSKLQLLCVLAGFASFLSVAQAGPPVRVGVGINIGAPAYRPYYYAPYYRPYPYYYYPPPAIVVAPPPVIYQPAPPVVYAPPAVAASPAPVVQPQHVEAPQPTPVYSSPPPVAARPGASFDSLINNLRSTDEAVRRDSVMELGRSKAIQAVQPLSATLAGDQSPVVREAAARALGLIGSPQGLPTLQYAAQADGDRDVRHSAQYAIEIIKSR